MITSTLVMPMIATSTLAVIIFIGLGFLPRPSRATALWSAAFAVAMVGSYIWLVQELVYPEQLRAIGSGLVVAPMPLLWSGLRAYRGMRKQYIPLACAFLVLVPTGLLLAANLGFYPVAFRVVFCAAAVFAVLIFRELVRLGPQLRDEALPLIGVSGAFVVFAAILVINGVLLANGIVVQADAMQFARTLNMIGSNVYIVCALITTLLLTIRSDGLEGAPHRDFERIARDRLRRAESANDQWWALLDIRLDDPDDIRLASSTAAFNAVCAQFAEDIDSVFPADADIEQLTPTHHLVLVPRPQGGVRELVSELLERVTAPEGHSSLPVRLSASIGWAPVAVVGYDFGALTARAAEACATASAKGGDRWERIRGAGE